MIDRRSTVAVVRPRGKAGDLPEAQPAAVRGMIGTISGIAG
jgi:hypothetical protein